jgi:nitroimidazol reductase NimA-like FMN-containing flavoprotein (pyridoxamine 5'-phosphate oxidase superfamily)
MSQGAVRRKDKEMNRAEIDRILGEAAFAHFATVSANGDPYVVPNLFVYADGLIHLHTSLTGHFLANVEARPRISFEVSEMGTVYPYGEFECDTTVSYVSVVGFGKVRIDSDPVGKARFFDRLMAKYADPKLQRPKSFYPRLDMVTVYAVEIERLTGKRGPLLAVGDQWPSKNMTKSPGAVAPGKK